LNFRTRERIELSLDFRQFFRLFRVPSAHRFWLIEFTVPADRAGHTTGLIKGLDRCRRDLASDDST
jgi:hypothetical protein